MILLDQETTYLDYLVLKLLSYQHYKENLILDEELISVGSELKLKLPFE